ncbi:BUD13 homolog [Salarias fasciatus]|uniref:BUD13 homolog n=1 Tax=Salarias fasciatus TaxID=181472 RepID=A0A672GAC2_SALFA|nr:BUD13 homolog [Salarias fasciatus]
MAASTGCRKGPELSKAEYLKRYLSADDDCKKNKGKIKKKRRKVPERGLKIVDDDIDWKQIVEAQEELEEEEDEAPVIAEVVDDRPDEVKYLEAFRNSNRWKVIGADENEDSEDGNGEDHQPADSSTGRHDSPDASPPRRSRHDSPDISPPRKNRHDSPDISPPRRSRHDSPDISPPRKSRHDSPDMSPPRRSRHDSPDMSPPRQQSGKVQSKDSSPNRRKASSSSASKKHSSDSHRSSAKRAQTRADSDSDQSPPRKKPPKGKGSDSDQSPPRRRGRDSDGDLSPPRRSGQTQGNRMLSGGKAGLVSVEVLRKEQEDNRRREKHNQPLEDESRNAQTVFRDKSGKRRDLDSEREEQKKKAGEKAAKDEKYAQWGKGLAQSQMQQQKLEDALHEAQKPLARHHGDEDLDRMLREQEREGDPMAALLKRKKDRGTKAPAKPQYKGPPPPPNRFNILPGYRWDGVDRSNGFEKKRYLRISEKKAYQEEAYKWSVEDM